MEVINASPIMNAEDKTLTVGDTFDTMEGVSATDKEDGDLTDTIQITENTGDISKVGKYTVVYEVKDSDGIRVVQMIFVIVEEKRTDADDVAKPEDDLKEHASQAHGENTSTTNHIGLFDGLLSVAVVGLLKRKNRQK